MELVTPSSSKDCTASKILRCMEWLQKQNNEVLQKLTLRRKKNDLKYIIQTNADRKKFLLSVGGDEATVPTGARESSVKPKDVVNVDRKKLQSSVGGDVASVPAGAGEPSVKPKDVPIHRLRIDNLRIECEWKNCKSFTHNYEVFQSHVQIHFLDVLVTENDGVQQYGCLWDVCGHKTSDYQEMIRHINYHAYHARLMAIGFNGRATLKLARCKKDSTKRNQLPNLTTKHSCLWTGCEQTFNSMQMFLDHVRSHTLDTIVHLCSWAGCGSKFSRRVFLLCHLRSHTKERQIACYHCGMHFANNRKLSDHLLRQNVSSDSPYVCTICGTRCASEYLLSEHARQHVSACVCSFCDMSAPTPAALANHVRYRHLPRSGTRLHACTHCDYRAVTKSDLSRHIQTHERKRKRKSDENGEDNRSDRSGYDSDVGTKFKKKVIRKYACHLCPEKQMRVFSRGERLTKHLVKEHGAQWPFGHSRFRYQVSEDGMYRLTTTRYEVLEVSEKIVDRHSGPKEFLNNKSEFELERIAEPTDTTPIQFGIKFKVEPEEIVEEPEEIKEELVPEKRSVEITMCDVDEQGNIIKFEVMYS